MTMTRSNYLDSKGPIHIASFDLRYKEYSRKCTINMSMHCYKFDTEGYMTSKN